jgi:hypothetical protein
MNKMGIVGYFSILTLTLGLSASLFAHHSQSQYDTSQTVAVEGTFTAISWSNPHSLFYLSGRSQGEKDAPVERWVVEGPSPRGMENFGFTKDAAKVGEKIILMGNPRRDGKRELLLLSVILPDGRKITFKPE